MSTPPPTTLLAGHALQRTLWRMALSILEDTGAHGEELCLVGIRTGGVPLAERIAEVIVEAEGKALNVGAIDIGLYRDDAATALPDASIGVGDIRFPVAGKQVVLVDDVLQTGRTIRAAIDCVLDYGRPSRIWLAVLFDRGGRELPIAPDFVGKVVDIPRGSKVLVDLMGGDGDRGYVVEKTEEERP